MKFESAPGYLDISAIEPGTAAIGVGAFTVAALVLYCMEEDMAMYAVIAAILGGFLLT